MKLTKQVPARTETLRIRWLKPDFMEISPRYRQLRSRRRRPMDKCYWCGHVFVDGEMMALAGVEGKTNKVLCQTCATEAALESKK